MRIWWFSRENWRSFEHSRAAMKSALTANEHQLFVCIRGLGGLYRQQKLGDIECSPWFAQTADICGPFAPLFCVVRKRALHLHDDFSRRICDRARICLDDQPGIAFLLPGDDVINDHRTGSSNRFLHRRASGFSDEQMALVKHTRKVVGPANDSCPVPDRGFDLRHEPVGTADGYGEIDTQVGESLCQFRRAAGGRMNHIQKAALRLAWG